MANFFTLAEVVFFILFIAFNVSTTLEDRPQIQGLQPSQAIVEPGGTITIQANAIDRDSDVLRYEWTAREGKLVDKDEPTVTWIAPSSIEGDEQEFEIRVTVEDGHQSSDKTASIVVRESPEIQVGIQQLCLLADSVNNQTKLSYLPSDFNGDMPQQAAPAFSIVKVNFQTQAQSQTSTNIAPDCPEITHIVKEGKSTIEKKSLIERMKGWLEKIKSIPGKLRDKLPCCETGGGFLIPCRRC